MDDKESGFVTVETRAGNTYNLFVFSSKDLSELKPRAQTYRKVAALFDEKTKGTKARSNKERIMQIVNN